MSTLYATIRIKHKALQHGSPQGKEREMKKTG